MTDDDLAWLGLDDRADEATLGSLAELRASLLRGVAGNHLPNAAYRFNLPGADRSPFRNVGQPGHEAETREVIRLAHDLVEHRSD